MFYIAPYIHLSHGSVPQTPLRGTSAFIMLKPIFIYHFATGKDLLIFSFKSPLMVLGRASY